MTGVDRDIGARPIASNATAALRNPEPDQLPHQGGRQGIVRLKANRALARAVRLELSPVRPDRRRAGIKGTVLRRRAKVHEQFPVQANRRDSVANALLRFGRRGLDRLAQLLKRRPLLAAQLSKVRGDGLGLGCFVSH